MPVPAPSSTNLDTLPPVGDAQRAAWQQGVLSWCLRPVQRRVYDAIHAAWPQGRFILEAHRRFGKDFIANVIVSERCIREPGSRWLYVAPTLEQAGTIAQDQFRQLLKTCPPHLAPRWVATRATYEFPNGSIIAFHSAEPRNRHRIRGLRANGAVLSEMRDMVGLEDLLGSVVGPALQYAPDGGMVIGDTTPPPDEEAEYNQLWATESAIPGRTLQIPLTENGDADASFWAQATRDCGGRDTAAFRCEYLCQRIPLATRLVLPALASGVVCTRDFLGDSWTAIDPGGKDLTAILHGSHGPGGLHVTGEWGSSSVDVDTFVSGGLAIETIPPRVRWIDKVASGDILRRTLNAKKWPVIPATYGNPGSAVGILKAALDRGVVTIDPSCETLLRTLRLAQWEDTEQQAKFRRMPRSGIGHADFLAALLLAVCNSVYVRRALGPVINEQARLLRMRQQASKLFRR